MPAYCLWNYIAGLTLIALAICVVLVGPFVYAAARLSVTSRKKRCLSARLDVYLKNITDIDVDIVVTGLSPKIDFRRI